jgi:hypothetical protein
LIVVVRGKTVQRQTPLTQIGETLNGLRLCLCPAQSGQKHAGKDGDNTNDNEQFDEMRVGSRVFAVREV